MQTNFNTMNPFDGSELEKYNFHKREEIHQLLQKSHTSYRKWSFLSLKERIRVLTKFRNKIDEKIDELALLASSEMGKPLSQGVGELNKSIGMMDYYFEHAESLLKPQNISTPFTKSQVHFSAQGTIFGIMPWNFPFWQVLRFAVPTLLVGNTVMIKHAPNVQGCQNLLQKIFEDSCDDAELLSIFTTVIAKNDDVPFIIKDQFVRGVSFTGSEATGRIIAELAGKNLKKAVLELGGSDAYLVLPDADIENAAENCFKARFVNSGQSCVAAKRWIVHRAQKEAFIGKIKEIFTNHFSDKYQSCQVAPINKDCALGPLARPDLKDNLFEQVSSSIAKGAKILIGELPDKQGHKCYFPPMILDQVTPGMPAFNEELFGPVATIITGETIDEMISLANQSDYGLGGAIFSKDVSQAESIAVERLDTGGVFINQFYQSHAALPFGGVKSSGIGRELSHLAFYEFANMKTIVQ